jgi:hypothetical protein
MIAMLGASAISLSLVQAAIAAPTHAFRECLREAATKAQSEKVGGDAIEDYLRNACTSEMGALKDAVVAFRMKNGMSKKAAASDADMTVEDYVATPADNYKFMINYNAPKPQPAAAPAASPAAAAAPAATPAPPAAAPAEQAASSQPHN